MSFGNSNMPTVAKRNGGARVSAPSSGRFCFFPLGAQWLTIAATLAIASAFELTALAQPVSEPLCIKALRQEYDSFIVEWSGGLPPYAVEVSPDAQTNWIRISPLLRDNSYADLFI